MATFDYPVSNRIFMPKSFSWGFRENSRIFESQLSGAIQTTSLPGTRWACSLLFENQLPADRAKIEGFFSLIRRENRMIMPRLDRLSPLGTMETGNVLLNSTLAQFGSTVSFKNCGVNKTLLAGSMVGIGSQLFMVAFDAISNSSGIMNVRFSIPSRANYYANQSVILKAPTTKWLYNSNGLDYGRSGQIATGLTIDLIEVF